MTFTQNIDKSRDFVNGQSGTISGVNAHGILVRTDTGYDVAVFPWTNENRVTFFPLKLGYAHNLLKIQGATLKHATFWFDVEGVEAAGYVALSRVQKDEDWQFVGPVTRQHFVPSRSY